MPKSRSTRIAARATGAVVVTALGLSLAACSGGFGATAVPGTSESVAASPTPSLSPTELSPEDKAIKQAEKVLREYYRVDAAMGKDPVNFDPEKFKKVAILDGLSYLQDVHRASVLQGVHQVGDIRIESIEVAQVDLAFKPKRTPPEIPTVELIVCSDVSDVHGINKNGEDVTNPDRDVRIVQRAMVSNFEYPDGPWLVGSLEREEGETC